MSNADKRTVATDALATLGTIIDEHQKRDAIHLAVMPVIAGEEDLYPGDDIFIVRGLAYRGEKGTGLGIVDPFLTKPVQKGERFWFIMRPRLIQSLRHVWSHPAFPDEPGVAPPAAEEVEARIAGAKSTILFIVEELGDGLTYREIMAAAEEWLRNGDYLTQHGSEDWRDRFPGYAEQFWEAYAIVKDAEIPEDKRQSFFSCSC